MRKVGGKNDGMSVLLASSVTCIAKREALLLSCWSVLGSKRDCHRVVFLAPRPLSGRRHSVSRYLTHTILELALALRLHSKFLARQFASLRDRAAQRFRVFRTTPQSVTPH